MDELCRWLQSLRSAAYRVTSQSTRSSTRMPRVGKAPTLLPFKFQQVPWFENDPALSSSVSTFCENDLAQTGRRFAWSVSTCSVSAIVDLSRHVEVLKMSLFGCPTRRAKHAKSGRDPYWLDPVRTDFDDGALSRVANLGGHRTRKVRVMQTYTAQLSNELSVTKGELVHLLHHARHWAYVINSEGTRGYIPFAFCGDPSTNPGLGHTGQVRDETYSRNYEMTQTDGGVRDGRQTNRPGGDVRDRGDADSICSGSSGLEALDLADTASLRSSMLPEMGQRMGAGTSMADVMPFFKVPYGQSAVLFDFEAEDENDVSVRRGENVVILNQDDPGWVWVRTDDRREGFVPRMFICPCGCTSIHETIVESLQASMQRQQEQQQQVMLEQRRRREAQQKMAAKNKSNSLPRHYTAAERDPGGYRQDAPARNVFKNGTVSDSNILLGAKSQGSAKPNRIAIDEEDDEEHGVREPSSNPPLTLEEQIKMVVDCDYEAQASDDLTVYGGQWVFATERNLQLADETDWLYVYSVESKRSGYIPKACASALAWLAVEHSKTLCTDTSNHQQATYWQGVAVSSSANCSPLHGECIAGLQPHCT